MGYAIYIGNAVVQKCEDELYAQYAVKPTRNKHAPRWENPVGADGKPDFRLGCDISEDTNGRHPSYTSMTNWSREVGLFDLFLGEDGREGLLNPHPGCHKLTHAISGQVAEALRKWKDAHVGAVPGWRSGEDAVLAKLIWYDWWIQWALKNCRLPAISNS